MSGTVWLHIRENDGHILTWHLESEDAPGTLCGQSTHDMEVVTEAWMEVFSRCRHCDIKVARGQRDMPQRRRRLALLPDFPTSVDAGGAPRTFPVAVNNRSTRVEEQAWPSVPRPAAKM